MAPEFRESTEGKELHREDAAERLHGNDRQVAI